MSARTYLTLQGDRLDWIAEKAFGTERTTTEQIIDANRGLAAKPIRLPLGDTILLPAAIAPVSPAQVNIWD
ncbi:tail protein X [Phreatobacter sp. HK31-P]